MDEKDDNRQQQNAPPPEGAPYNPQAGYGRPYHQPWQKTYRDPYKGTQRNWEPEDCGRGESASNDEKAFSILSYIGILWLVGLLADKENPRVVFHVNQGIILSIFEFALTFSLGIVNAALQSAFGFAFSGIGVLSWTGTAISGVLSFTGWCLIVAYIIIGVVHAAQGKQEPLPLIGTLFTVIH